MKKDSIEYNGFVGGAIVLIGLIAYFFIMKALGLANNVELRVFNFVFMAAGVYYAITSLKKKNDEFTYLKGLGVGFLAAASSTFLFSVFMMLYTSILNPEFLVQLKENEAYSKYMTPFSVGLVVLIEGIFSGSVFAFGYMQWFKEQHTSDKFLKEQRESSKSK